MATELITQTWCDKCLVDAGERTAHQKTATVRVNGLTKKLDLCEQHYRELVAPVTEWLEHYGTPPTNGDRPPRATQLMTEEPDGKKLFTCSLCGSKGATGRGMSRSSYRTHAANVHHINGADWVKFGPPTKYKDARYEAKPCPYCDRQAIGAQGLAAHIRMTHADRYEAWQAATR